jgi:hypothetical protein
MRWSLTIGRFGEAAVMIHLTFLLLLAWIGFSALHEGGRRGGARQLQRRPDADLAWSGSQIGQFHWQEWRALCVEDHCMHRTTRTQGPFGNEFSIGA